METNKHPERPKQLLRASAHQRRTAAIVFVVLFGIFVFFWLAATGRIDISNFFDPCGFKQRYDLPCPTCGITTSAITFARGQMFKAFYIQPAGALLCCVMVVSAVLAFFIAVSGMYFHFLERFFAEVKIRYIITALIVIILAGWVVTLARTFSN